MTMSTVLLLLLLLASLILWAKEAFRAPSNTTAAAGYWIATVIVALALVAKELP